MTKAEERQQKRPRASSPGLTVADLASASQTAQLPLERERVAVKTVKTSWYKQLIKEDALDQERGTLRGKPLAVLSVHGRACPSASHVHLLWERSDGVLRLSLFFMNMWDDPRYKEVQKQSQKRLQARFDLLALLLAPTASYDTNRDDRKQVRMDAYQLSISLDVYKVLEQVQKTRESYQRDGALWQRWVQSVYPPEQDGKPAPQRAEAVTQAREVIKELTELGVRVFHPDLIDRRHLSWYADSFDRPNSIYQSKVEAPTDHASTRTPAPFGANDTVLLYWKRSWADNPFDDETEKSSTDLVTDATMRRLGRTHGYALRLALIEPALQEAQKLAESRARSYATSWSLLQDAPTGENEEKSQRVLPAPTTIWEQICQEKQTFEEYCQRLKESALMVAGLEQLFVA